MSGSARTLGGLYGSCCFSTAHFEKSVSIVRRSGKTSEAVGRERRGKEGRVKSRTGNDSLSARFLNPICRFPPDLLSIRKRAQNHPKLSKIVIDSEAETKSRNKAYNDPDRNFSRTTQFRHRDPSSPLQHPDSPIPPSNSQPFAISAPFDFSNS